MRGLSLPFRFPVVAGVTVGRASNPLPVPCTLQEILMIFPTGTGNGLIYRFFEDQTGKVPTTGAVGGIDIFSETTDVGEFVGDNVIYVVPHQAEFAKEPTYIKMQAQNTSLSPLIANAILYLQKR